MTISIITVTKNNKNGLLRAIESVRSQTYKNVEHIIVDGLSTDGTKEILKQVQNDILRQTQDDTLRSAQGVKAKDYNLQFISEADSGIYDAINKGIRLATGDVIGLLHSDDFFADEFVLEKYAEAFQQDERLKGKGFIQDKRLKEKDKSFIQDKRLKRNDESIPSSRMDLRDLKISPPTSRGRNDRTQDDKQKDDKGLTNGNQPPTADNRQPNIDAVYSDLVYVRSKTREEKREQNNYESTDHLALNIDHSVLRNWETQKKEFTTETQRNREILNGWMPPHPTLFVRREVFEKYGLYRTDMKIAADYEMILRLFYKYKITTHYLPLTTFCMTIGGASNKSIRNIFIKSSEDYRAMKLHQVPFPIKTLLFKNLRKLPQFFR